MNETLETKIITTPVVDIDMRNFQFDALPTFDSAGRPTGFVNNIKRVTNWDGVSNDIITGLNLFVYNGVYVYRNKKGEVVTLDETPTKAIRKHTASLLPNIPPTINKQIADAVIDRVVEIVPDLDNNVIYYANGELDTKTGKFTEQIDVPFNHRRIIWNYTPKEVLAKTHNVAIGKLNDFLAQISDKDVDIQKQILQMIGVSLMPTGQFRKAFFLLGEGGNGKSSLLNLLARVHGEGKISRIGLEHMTGSRAPFMSLSLVNKTVNIIDDLSNVSMRENGIFKSIVAGEGMLAEVKGGKIFNFYNEATFIAGGNSIPALNDKGSSTAITDRMVIIPLNHKFAKTPTGVAKRDRLMKDDVIEVLATLVGEAAVIAQKTGLVEGFRTKKANAAFEMENDSVKYWIENSGDVPTKPNDWIKPTDLYNMYKTFAQTVNIKPVGIHNFGKSISKHLSETIVKKKKRTPEGSINAYVVVAPEPTKQELEFSGIDL